MLRGVVLHPSLLFYKLILNLLLLQTEYDHRMIIYMNLKATKMRNIKLTENDCTFVHYALRYYANHTEGLDGEDREEIYGVARKFK